MTRLWWGNYYMMIVVCTNNSYQFAWIVLFYSAACAPRVEVLTSSFASEWHTMMSDTETADVRFLFSDGQHIDAHKTVLVTASTIFENIFLNKVTLACKSYADILDDIYWLCDDKDCCPNPIHNEEICTGKGKTVIALNKSLSKNIFTEVLTFLYTGSPGLAKNEDVNFVKEVQSFSIKFRLNWLEAYCTNILNEESFLNSSIRTWINDNTGLAAKKLFLNKKLQADVKFLVKDSIVYGHRVILKARSEVMAAMFKRGAFREGDLNAEVRVLAAHILETNLFTPTRFSIMKNVGEFT